ncbi:tyrosine-type recombinase/integrase [Hyphococcus sp. DH-69]|uniref:tyrosine-type recombinase/integrase n=1 Tax=Hyphococcus formosus TaxID=3143534 RepID=UPI00398A87C7
MEVRVFSWAPVAPLFCHKKQGLKKCAVALGTQKRYTRGYMTRNLPYLFERNGSFYFRRRIPARFHDLAGCSEWKLALGKDHTQRSQTLLELRALSEATDEAIAQMRRNNPVSRTLLSDALIRLYPERQSVNSISIEDAAKGYADSKGLLDLHKAEKMAVEQFLAFSNESSLVKIKRINVRDWIAWLRTTRGQSEATIRRRLGSLSAIYAYAMDVEDDARPNPFSRHRLLNADHGYRLPFQRNHLSLIDEWLNGSIGKRPTGQIIRLLRATGARPLEIGGLCAEEIRLDVPIPFLMLRPNALRGLKTTSSQRAIPLVGDGIAVAREILSHANAGAVFPKTCHHTGSLSARLNKGLRSAGIPHSPKFTAYSFRHSIEENLRLTGATFDVQQAILGHAKRTTTERYGSKHVSLERMRDALNAVTGLQATSN